MSTDPMTSYDQAEADARERFYEDRDDADAAITAAEANRVRRRALWNRHCIGGHHNPEHCPCIVLCDDCGHVAVEHEITDGFTYGLLAGKCDKAACTCRQYRVDE